MKVYSGDIEQNRDWRKEDSRRIQLIDDSSIQNADLEGIISHIELQERMNSELGVELWRLHQKGKRREYDDYS